jgi:hypothetical protein
MQDTLYIVQLFYENAKCGIVYSAYSAFAVLHTCNFRIETKQSVETNRGKLHRISFLSSS